MMKKVFALAAFLFAFEDNLAVDEIRAGWYVAHRSALGRSMDAVL